MRVVSAPSPDEKARQWRASSSAARHSSRALRVGLPVREYSNPLCSPTPCWAKVVAMWIGWTTAPVAGSGPCPTCKARVENPQPFVLSGKSMPGRGQLGDAVALHQVDRLADRTTGFDSDQGREILGVLRKHLADAHRAQAREVTVLPHPLVAEELAQVVASGVRKQHDDHLVRLALARDLHRGMQREPRGAADQDALLAREPARSDERLLVGDLDDLVDDLDVHRPRHEVLAHALHLVRRDRP